MYKPYYMKWCIAHVMMFFPKLKGCVKTESRKRFIYPGEGFMPLNNDLQFTFIGYANPMFTIDGQEGGEG